MFSFKCASCDEVHEGMPSFGVVAPFSYYEVPENEWDTRCELRTDECIIDRRLFFVRGCIEIPVAGQAAPFVWTVWVSLSESSFSQWTQFFSSDQSTASGPFFGWLNVRLKPYPNTLNLKTRVHLRPGRLRPYIELEPTHHLLALEQRHGISLERVAQLYAAMTHVEVL